MSEWKITTRGFKELQEEFRDAPRKMADLGRQWAKDVAADETKYIIRAAPSRTGRFRKTISPYSRAFIVGVEFQPYGKLGLKLKDWIIEGTRPHEIVTHRARALAFKWRGKMRFFTRVNHPGTRPNDFVARGARKFDSRTRYWLDELGRRVVKMLGG